MKRRMVRIGGDDYEVMDEGNCFIETKRNRYCWREGELKRFAAWETLGKAGKDGRRKPVLNSWGYDRFTGRDIVELYGPEYDKGRGHECWIKIAGEDEPMKLPAPEIAVVVGSAPESRPTGKRSKQRRHGPDYRPQYNRRNNPELGRQLRAWFRDPKNKDASINAGATWAATLFDRKDGCLKKWKLPCQKVLWNEARKQKPKARSER